MVIHLPKRPTTYVVDGERYLLPFGGTNPPPLNAYGCLVPIGALVSPPLDKYGCLIPVSDIKQIEATRKKTEALVSGIKVHEIVKPEPLSLRERLNDPNFVNQLNEHILKVVKRKKFLLGYTVRESRIWTSIQDIVVEYLKNIAMFGFALNASLLKSYIFNGLTDNPSLFRNFQVIDELAGEVSNSVMEIFK